MVIRAKRGEVRLGEMTILAHGSTVKGPASLGETGTCPGSSSSTTHCPSFVGFNSEVDGAIIQKDAMVLHLAKVGRGVTIPSGRKVLSGKYVASQGEVDSKTAAVTEADRAFMDGVIEVNVEFAKEYPVLTADANNRTGINLDPGNTDFNPTSELPSLAGTRSRVTGFRNRIIGDVRLANNIGDLDGAMDNHISLRADEGEPFVIGTIAEMNSHVVFHALEHTHIGMGNSGFYGEHVIVHGGPTAFPLGTVKANNATVTGNNVEIKKSAVFFRSRIGANSTIGSRSLVQQVDCPASTIIGRRQVVIGDGTNCPAPSYAVEW